ncbi:hypothetical protein BGW38_010188, partial [Lunasporangiospora selenospora]
MADVENAPGIVPASPLVELVDPVTDQGLDSDSAPVSTPGSPSSQQLHDEDDQEHETHGQDENGEDSSDHSQDVDNTN